MSRSNDFPRILEIELNRHCNLACRMCQRQVVRAPSSPGLLESRVLDEVLAQVGDRSPQINLGGLGESLMHPGLPSLLADIKRHNPAIATGFNTNALLLDRSRWPWMLDGRLDYLTISFDAPDAAAYRWLIGADAFSQVASHARQFLLRKGKGRPPLTTVHTFNIPEFAQGNRDFAAEWSDLADFVQVRALGNWAGTVDLGAFGVTPPPLGKCDRPWLSLAIDLNGGYHRCCASFALTKPSASVFDTSIASYWGAAEAAALRESMERGCFAQATPAPCAQDAPCPPIPSSSRSFIARCSLARKDGRSRRDARGGVCPLRNGSCLPKPMCSIAPASAGR
jgi:hypothetical protein